MVYIPEDTVNAIKNTADIVEIISETVILKKAGKNYLGLCPFHSEKTPSFTVSPDKQIFFCFGCRAGGNVFSFLMKQDGLLFPIQSFKERIYFQSFPARKGQTKSIWGCKSTNYLLLYNTFRKYFFIPEYYSAFR